MAEAHQARVQNVVEDMVQSLERDNIRKMQVGVHLCTLICTTYTVCACNEHMHQSHVPF